MTMMTQPDDTLFQDMLQDYAAPIADDGFSTAVMTKIADTERRAARLRRVTVSGAALLGGIMAATQVPALVQMLPPLPRLRGVGLDGAADLSTPLADMSTPLADMSLSGLPIWAWPCLLGAGFVLWAALDQRGLSNL